MMMHEVTRGSKSQRSGQGESSGSVRYPSQLGRDRTSMFECSRMCVAGTLGSREGNRLLGSESRTQTYGARGLSSHRDKMLNLLLKLVLV